MEEHSPLPKDGLAHLLLEPPELPEALEREGLCHEALIAEFLGLVHGCTGSRQFIEAASRFFHERSECDALGIRLREGVDFPYYQTRGFSAEFVSGENHLCLRDRHGCPLRDLRGCPRLECLCGAVISAAPLFQGRVTSGGTLFIGDLQAFERTLDRADRLRLHVRGRCFSEGYRALALFPLPGKSGRIGLMQFNYRRPMPFTPEFLTLWERLAGLFAVALQKFQTEEALRQSREKLERKLAERTAQLQAANAALQESEMRFRQMAESVQEAFWLVDLEDRGRILYVSPACRDILGCSPRELYEQPKKWLSAIHLADRRRVCRSFTSLSDGWLGYHEYRIVRADGSIRWISNEGVPVRNGEGRPVRMAGVIRDITEIKRLQAELLQISEREQQHIAQELHDGICQHLTGTSLVCKVLLNQLTARNDPAAQDMARVCRLLNTAVYETRQLSHGLYPVRSGEGGLSTALARLAKTVSSLFSVACVFRSSELVDIASETAATHLYRIAQEAVNNAIRHGEARRIRISLRRRGGRIFLSVADNGRGIPAPPPENPGLGLRIMAHRASESGGQLRIGRGRRGGTVVVCSIPAG